MHVQRATIALSMTVCLSTSCCAVFAAKSSPKPRNNTAAQLPPAPSPPPKAPPPPSPVPVMRPATPLLDTRVARPGEALLGPDSQIPTRVSRPGESGPAVPSPSVGGLGSRPYTPAAVGMMAAPGAKDPYPAIGQLEAVTLGAANPAMHIDQRLANLETAIFQKTFAYDSLFDRTERLKKTILGNQEVDPNSAAGREDAAAGRSPGTAGGDIFDSSNSRPTLESLSEVRFLDEQAALPENKAAATELELAQYAVMLINKERTAFGVAPVTPDNLAEKIASDLTKDLAKRNVLSHFSSDGSNPDRRFTLNEGNDAVNEGIASVKTSEVGVRHLCKAGVARILKTMLSRQDDRDALLNPDATHVGFASALSADGEKIIAAAEVLSRHAVMIPLATEVAVGDKVEVRGVMNSPYFFDKVTVAWEAYNPESNASAADDGEEALPYFPPLDYIAYSNRGEGNHDKAVFALKAGLIVGAVAAGMFFPPAAMAVPLIALAGSPGEPKPVSDIPVKGGIKVDGAAFSGHIPLSNNSKEGLYYVTVWAVQAKGMKSVPVSRRVILAKSQSPQQAEAADDEKAKEERKEQERREKDDRKAKLMQEKREKQEEKIKKREDKNEKRPGLTVEGEVEPAEPAEPVDLKNSGQTIQAVPGVSAPDASKLLAPQAETIAPKDVKDAIDMNNSKDSQDKEDNDDKND